MIVVQFALGVAITSAMTPELGTLQAFVAVADCGGFAQAALRLGLSVSIVSRRIAALEAQLNVQLLVRTTRGMALTEAGGRFHARSRELLAGLALACEEVREDTDSVVGLVRLTAPQSLLGVALVAPVVAELLARHPGLRFDLSLDERKLDLVSGAIDVAVRVGPVPDSRSFARRLAVLEGRLVASPDYLARHGTPRSAADLSAHVSLEHTELGPQGLWRMEGGEPPRQLVRANSFEVIHQLARAGAGLAVMPSFAVRDDLDRGVLCLLLPHWQSPPFELFAVAPPAARLSARARLVMDALSAHAELAFADTGPQP
jgi:DNA-binding transcriptional LysR family regulator